MRRPPAISACTQRLQSIANGESFGAETNPSGPVSSKITVFTMKCLSFQAETISVPKDDPHPAFSVTHRHILHQSFHLHQSMLATKQPPSRGAHAQLRICSAITCVAHLSGVRPSHADSIFTRDSNSGANVKVIKHLRTIVTQLSPYAASLAIRRRLRMSNSPDRCSRRFANSCLSQSRP